MSAQIGDVCKYVNKNYDVLSIEKEFLFNPREYKLNLRPHSACWRGYYGEFSFNKKKLTLNNLCVYSPEDNPTIKGIKIRKKQGIFSDFGVYQNVNIVMDTSGYILIARGFLPDYYASFGKQTPLMYETVYELKLNNGEIVETVDLSDQLKDLRNLYGVSHYDNEIKEKVRLDIKKILKGVYKEI